jgi:hypothetical protein
VGQVANLPRQDEILPHKATVIYSPVLTRGASGPAIGGKTGALLNVDRLCFSAAWCFSSFLDSPTFSIANVLSLAVAIVSFTVGMIYYLRRVEP